ncbi:hypothetical protein ACIOD2_07160 [Amycolatopsis sp. NPDC088138]|uniref:hypothetical protein n=1 Tax=Amycolatopsis sp. NPDC088138 TaxID=3363938 RepID=UPI0037FA4A43
MNRRSATAGLGTTGALLGVVAGLIQATVGAGIPELTGDKLAHGALGLLTTALAAVAGFAALRQRKAGLSVLSRAACSLALIGPGLLCLTTVGRLWYLPAALLTTAGVLTVDSWRDTAAALVRSGPRVLLTALAGCEVLMAAAGPALLMVVGGLGAAALVAAAWWRTAPRSAVLALVLSGTVPFGLLGWTALVPLVLAVLALLLSLPLLRGPVHDGARALRTR